MKKNLILALAVLAVAGSVITGCGNNKEVVKTDESQAVITEVTEAATETITEAETEVVTEVSTEEVKSDFLAEHGLKVTPNGSMIIPVAKWDSDELVDLPVVTSVETAVSSEEGYSDTTFTIIADISVVATTGWSYGLDFFDRYTGTVLSVTKASFVNGGSTHDNVAVVDIDGRQYDCSYEAGQDDNGGTSTITVKVHHPSEYDGLVFVFGPLTKTQREINAETSTSEDAVVNMADNLDNLEGQYFFTVTDK